MLDIADTLDSLLDARARHVEQAELGLEDEDIDEHHKISQTIIWDDQV
jgi:hypothetical protein